MVKNKRIEEARAELYELIKEELGGDPDIFFKYAQISCEEFIDYMILELVVQAYDKKAPKLSGIEYVKRCIGRENLENNLSAEDEIDRRRKELERICIYVDEKKRIEYRDILKNSRYPVIRLNPPKLKKLQKKIEGRKKTEVGWESIEIMHRLGILKKVCDSKLGSRHNKENFEKYMDEYDEYIESLIKSTEETNDSLEIVKNAIQYFALSQRYPFDFLYKISKEQKEPLCGYQINTFKMFFRTLHQLSGYMELVILCIVDKILVPPECINNIMIFVNNYVMGSAKHKQCKYLIENVRYDIRDYVKVKKSELWNELPYSMKMNEKKGLISRCENMKIFFNHEFVPNYSRFIKEQDNYITTIISPNTIENNDIVYEVYLLLWLKSVRKKIERKFINNVAFEDMADFLMEYNIFQAYEKKEWTKERKKYFLELINEHNVANNI